MALSIRLSRGGAKKRPYYRIVVADARSPRDGRFIERIGSYNPLLSKDDANRIVLDVERAKHWVSVGAQPTDRVARFLDTLGVVERSARSNPNKGKPGEKAVERAEERAAKVAAAEEAAKAPAPAPVVEEEAAVEDAPAVDAVTEVAPAVEAVAEEAPAADVAEEAPAAEAVAEEAPAAEEVAPVEEPAPVEEAAAEAPTEDAEKA